MSNCILLHAKIGISMVTAKFLNDKFFFLISFSYLCSQKNHTEIQDETYSAYLSGVFRRRGQDLDYALRGRIGYSPFAKA